MELKIVIILCIVIMAFLIYTLYIMNKISKYIIGISKQKEEEDDKERPIGSTSIKPVEITENDSSVTSLTLYQKNRTIKGVAECYNNSLSDILSEVHIAEDYLNSFEKPNKWSLEDIDNFKKGYEELKQECENIMNAPADGGSIDEEFQKTRQKICRFCAVNMSVFHALSVPNSKEIFDLFTELLFTATRPEIDN